MAANAPSERPVKTIREANLQKKGGATLLIGLYQRKS